MHESLDTNTLITRLIDTEVSRMLDNLAQRFGAVSSRLFSWNECEPVATKVDRLVRFVEERTVDVDFMHTHQGRQAAALLRQIHVLQQARDEMGKLAADQRDVLLQVAEILDCIRPPEHHLRPATVMDESLDSIEAIVMPAIGRGHELPQEPGAPAAGLNEVANVYGG